ncbi:MAG: 2-phospho-L-lactate guanylyltransferase [Azonexus sp.]|jgi:2-phospho-L-lactate guanylyltransferase|nr:2-phospho-L-lactate guanylyltransferase [Azonexus sp.]
MRRLWALAPLKNLARAKTRLAETLADSCRSALVMAMARDVMAALAQSRSIERLVLVSDMPDSPELIGVPGLTRHPGVGGGLNQDLTAAALWASAQGATHALFVHADLPLLTPAAVDRFVAGDDDCPDGLRIAPCKQGVGTNLLLTPLPLPLPLVYGAGSLARFQSLAAAAGLDCALWRDPTLAMDIDESTDYATLQLLCEQGRLPDGATAALLRRPMSRGLRTEMQPQLRYGSSAEEKLALSSP